MGASQKYGHSCPHLLGSSVQWTRLLQQSRECPLLFHPRLTLNASIQVEGEVRQLSVSKFAVHIT